MIPLWRISHRFARGGNLSHNIKDILGVKLCDIC